MNRLIYFFLSIVLCQVLQGCTNQEKSNSKVLEKTYSIKQIQKDTKVPEKLLFDISESIPAYTDLFWHIEELKTQYNPKLLTLQSSIISPNFLKIAQQPEDIFFKTFWNLGTYTYHLGYCQTHKQEDKIELYLDLIEKEVKTIEFDSIFDIRTIRQSIKTNPIDTRIKITKANLKNINQPLFKYKCTRMSGIMLASAFLEHLYFICETIRHKPSKLQTLETYLQESAIILDQILLLLSFYEDKNPNIKDLMNDFFKIKKIYDSDVRSVESLQCMIFMTDFSKKEVLHKFIKTVIEIRDKMLFR